jgi:hypothetical protein
MSDQVEVIITTGLINKLHVHSIISYGHRTFNAQLSLSGEFAIQSDDLLPIPLPVLWYGYLEIHKQAVYLRTGEMPDADHPVDQLRLPVTTKKSLQEKLNAEGTQ